MKALSSGLLAVLLFSACLVSCEREFKDVKGDVNIYLLADYQRLPESDGISLKGLELQDRPLIPYRDITLYNCKDHVFTITHQAFEKLKDEDWPVHGRAFAVCIGDEAVYTGYFWPSYSSASCQWTVIDPIGLFGNKLKVELGYPGYFEDANIPDHRNDQRLLNVFERDGKLR